MSCLRVLGLLSFPWDSFQDDCFVFSTVSLLSSWMRRQFLSSFLVFSYLLLSLISFLWLLWRPGTGTGLGPVKAFLYCYLRQRESSRGLRFLFCRLLRLEVPCQNEISFLMRKLILLAKGLSSGEDLCQKLFGSLSFISIKVVSLVLLVASR